jgi:hypothetical protein
LNFELGEKKDLFTCMIFHGGFFMGTGSNKGYLNSRIAWFDFCETETWSVDVINNIIEEIGYESAGRVKPYWCLPMRMLEDGDPGAVRCIWQDHDIAEMVDSVKSGNQFLVMYLDHDETYGAFDLDDVAAYPATELPQVIRSPMKQKIGGNEAAENEFCADGAPVRRSSRYTSNVAANEDDYISDAESDDEEYVPELIDSEYDISEDDEGLLEEQILSQKKKKCRAALAEMKGKQVEEEIDEEREMKAAESDEEAVNYNFHTFSTEDLTNPTFKLGQTFASINILRKALKEYSCKERVNLSMLKNDKTRIHAKCEDGCPWSMWASYDCRSKCILIKKFSSEHTCTKNWKVKAFTSTFLAEKYIETFRADDKMALRNFSRTVQKEWHMKPSRSQLGRARRAAMRSIYGDEVEQYNCLWDYAAELRRSNPGSSFFLNQEDDGMFKSCYFSFDACKRGFLAACRPVICLDGTFLKTQFGGILLTAIGMDPNDCIFPVAFAVVKVEDTDTWTWFLETLKADLIIDNTAGWTIMSDKQKVSTIFLF